VSYTSSNVGKIKEFSILRSHTLPMSLFETYSTNSLFARVCLGHDKQSPPHARIGFCQTSLKLNGRLAIAWLVIGWRPNTHGKAILSQIGLGLRQRADVGQSRGGIKAQGSEHKTKAVCGTPFVLLFFYVQNSRRECISPYL